MQRQLRRKAGVKCFALVVVEGNVIEAVVGADGVSGNAANEAADDGAALLRDLVCVGDIEAPDASQLGGVKSHFPGADQRAINGDGEVHIRLAKIRVVEEVVHAILHRIHIQKPSFVWNLNPELMFFIAL